MNIHPIFLQFQEIIGGSIPGWVWHRSPGWIGDHVPVFTFHTVKPDAFESQLRFLKENGYQTLTSEEHLQYVLKGKKNREKAVMLTFDDGRKSVWSVAGPLLKRYHMQATVFLSPGIMNNTETLSPKLDDPETRGKDTCAVYTCDQSDMPTLSWKEIRILHEERIIDFQCHSYAHQRIPVSPKVTGYVSPEMIRSHFFKFGIPYYPGILPMQSDPNKYLGAPVYESAPSLSGRRMYLEGELRMACIEYVRNHGGIQFFSRSGWQDELNRIAGKYSRKGSGNKYESDRDQKKRMTTELIKARQMIESHLPGHRVQHLAYPWGTGSDLAIHSSREAGYQSNYWSALPHRSCNRPGSDPFHLVRLKHDFIWRLPGEGRRSLKDLFLFKLKRRASGKIDY